MLLTLESSKSAQNQSSVNESLKPLSHCTLVPENCQKIAGVLLCERKHVPGLIPGLIPGWDLVTLPGSVLERALCEQEPDQCRKGCVVVMTHFIVRLLPGVLKADQRSHDERCVNWNEAAIRELLTICSEAEIIQFSEMVSAHYTRHMKGHVSLRDLYGLCVNARTDSGKSLAV